MLSARCPARGASGAARTMAATGPRAPWRRLLSQRPRRPGRAFDHAAFTKAFLAETATCPLPRTREIVAMLRRLVKSGVQ